MSASELDGARRDTPHRSRRVPHFARAALVVAAVGGITALGTWHEMEDLLELGLDTHVRFARPVDASRVALVRITNRDYRNLFGGQSPLDPGRLQALIDAVGAARPLVIGVDLDTSDPRFAALRPPPGVPVVWAHVELGRCAGGAGCLVGRLLPQPLRTGAAPDSLGGLALLARETGGVLRFYERRLDGAADVETFGTRVARIAGVEPRGDPRASRLIPYRKTAWAWESSAGEVLRAGNEQWWRERSPLRGKIVLLGGAYDGFPDIHDTPLGPMPGVDVWAHVVAAELEERGAPEAPARLVVALLAFFEGMALVVLFHRLGVRRGALAALVSIPVAVLACSYVTTRSFAFWSYFLPVLVAVLLLQFYEQVVEYRNRALVSRIAPPNDGS